LIELRQDHSLTAKRRDGSLSMFRLQKHTSCLKVLIYLLVVSLGAGGLVLCVRKDGQSRLNHAFNRCHESNPNCSGGSINCASSSQESGSVSGCSCEKRVSCLRIPIVLIASTRTSVSSLSSLPADPLTPCLSLPAVALQALCAWSHTAISRSVDLYHHSSENLRSTVLII
jgi:hypothetical protein